jgi:hypothetical protein
MKTFLPLGLSFVLLSLFTCFAAENIDGDQTPSGKETMLALPVPENFGNSLAFGWFAPKESSEEINPGIIVLQTAPSGAIGGFLEPWPADEPPPVRLLEPWLTDQRAPVRLLEPWIIREEAAASADSDPQLEPE